MASLDERFNEAEADVDRGEPWYFRAPDAPNPLTIEALEWSTGTTKLGKAEFLNGVDRDGKRWSILVGSVVLKKRLIEGAIEEWSGEHNAFVVVKTLGRVARGEIVSLKYIGDVEGEKYTYPNFKVSRKPASAATATEPAKPSEPAMDEQPPAHTDADFPSLDDDDITF
jgi:hypothetical protein